MVLGRVAAGRRERNIAILINQESRVQRLYIRGLPPCLYTVDPNNAGSRVQSLNTGQLHPCFFAHLESREERLYIWLNQL